MATSQPNDSGTDDSDSGQELFDFVIIEFIKRGRKTTKKCVHVVPLSWLNYNNKTKHYTCPFPPEPYDNLENIVKKKLPPDESWNIYNVKVKGHDSDYKQAKKKMKKLEVKDNVFSTDTDLNSTEKTKQLEQAVKMKLLKESLTAMKKNMNLDKSTEHLSCLNNNLSSEPTSSDGVSDISETGSLLREKSSKHRKLVKKSIHQQTTTENHETIPASCSNKRTESAQRFIDLTNPIDAYISNDGAIVVSDISKRNECNNNIQDNKLNCVSGISQDHFMELMEKLTCLDVELKTLTVSMHRIQNILQQQLEYTPRREVTNRFGTDFPIQDIDKLRDIDKQLRDDNDLRMKLNTAMSSVIDLDATLSINATEVLKKIFKRVLAMQFTAARQMENKFVFSSEAPNLCNCIRECLASHLQKNPKKVMSALGTAFTNSKDWDGHRIDRNKKAKNSTTAPDAIEA